VALPYVGLGEEEAMPIAPDFATFLQHLGRKAPA
jgi:hypothetical protein